MTNSVPTITTVTMRDLKTYLSEILKHKEFKELHTTLGIANRTWMGRRFSDPGIFKEEELHKLAEITGLSEVALMDEFGVAMKSMSAADADAIRKGLTAADIPAGKPAGGTQTDAK